MAALLRSLLGFLQQLAWLKGHACCGDLCVTKRSEVRLAALSSHDKCQCRRIIRSTTLPYDLPVDCFSDALIQDLWLSSAWKWFSLEEITHMGKMSWLSHPSLQYSVRTEASTAQRDQTELWNFVSFSVFSSPQTSLQPGGDIVHAEPADSTGDCDKASCS